VAVSQESLSVEVILDSSGAIKGLKDLNGNFISINKSVEKTDKTVSEFERAIEGMAVAAKKGGAASASAFDKMSGALTRAFVPITALNQGMQLLTAVVSSVSNAVGGFVTAFAAAERAQVQLEKALGLVAGRVNNTAVAWDGYLDAIEKTTGADADLLKGLVATALQIGLSEKQTRELVDASTKLAEVTGSEVAPVFDRLLQSYKGQARALAVYAPELANLTQEQLRNGEGVTLLLAKYKDVESTFGKTLAGSLGRVRIGFEDVSKAMGKSITEFSGLQNTLASLAVFLQQVQGALQSVDFTRLGQQVRTFTDSLVLVAPALAAIALAFGTVRAAATAALVPIIAATAKFVAIAAAIAGVISGIDILARNFTRVGDAFKTLGDLLTTGILMVIRNIVRAIADLVGVLPGMEKFAEKLNRIGESADKLASKTVARVKDFSKSLDLGLAGEVFTQGTAMWAAFNGEAEKTGDILKDTNAKAGARGGSLLDSEALKKIADEAKKAGEAFLGFRDSIRSLQDQADLLAIEIGAGPDGLDAAEKTYQLTLRTIEAARAKAILDGASIKAADEVASKGLLLAEAIRGQTQALEVQKSVRDSMRAAENAATAAVNAAYAQAQAANEELLRIGMSRTEIIDRQLQIELDKLDAIEAQVRASRELTSADKAALDVARKTAQAKADSAKAPAPGSAEGAPGIGGIASAVSSAIGPSSPIGAIMSAAEMITGLIQKLIDFLPNILNAVANIFSSVADLPNMILDAVKNVIGSIIKFTAEFIPNLFKAVPEIIDQILTAAFDTIPEAAQKLLDNLPIIIGELLRRIPELITKVIDGLISSSFEIGAGVMRAIIALVPALIKSIIRLIPAIVKSIIKGVFDGIKNIGKAFSSIFKGAAPNIGKGISAGFAQGLKKLTGFKGDLFGITDDIMPKGATDEAEKIIGAIKAAGDDAFAWLKKAWELLKQAFKFVYDTFLEPFISVLKATWAFVVSSFKAAWKFSTDIFKAVWEFATATFTATWNASVAVFKAVAEFFTATLTVTWQFVKDGILDPFITILKGTWDVIKSGVIDPFISILSATWQFVKDGIMDPVISALQAVWNFAKSMFDVVIDTFSAMWNFVKTLFDDPIQAFKNLWADLTGIFDRMVAAFGTLGGKLWDSLKAAFDASWAYIKSIGSAIWEGLKESIVNGYQALMDAGGRIWEAFKNLWNSGIAALSNLGASVWNAFKSAWDAGISALSNLGSSIWNGFKSAWESTKDGIGSFGTGLWNSFKSAFSGVGKFFTDIFNSLKPDNLMSKLFNLPKQPAPGTVEKFIGLNLPFVTFATGGMVPGRATVVGDSKANDTVPALLSPGEAVIPRSLMKNPAVAKLIAGILGGEKPEGFFTGGLSKIGGAIVGGVSSAGSAIGGAVSSAASAVGDFASSAASAAGSALKSVGGMLIPQWVENLYNSLSKVVSGINLVSLAKDPMGYITSIVASVGKGLIAEPLRNSLKFSQGGIVPGSGNNDSVRAMLTPGEFVMSKPAVASIGASTLAAMNASGGTAQQRSSDVSITLNINTEQPIDEGFVRRTLMPTVKEEMRKASLRGEFLLSARGVRA